MSTVASGSFKYPVILGYGQTAGVNDTRSGMIPTARDVVERFWAQMTTNDFRFVGALLADDFVLDWLQSGERIRSRDNFAAMNEEYPAHGRWRFTLNRLVGSDREAVSDVAVTDGFQTARVISFFTVERGSIARMTEFCPEPFEAPENCRHLVERIS